MLRYQEIKFMNWKMHYGSKSFVCLILCIAFTITSAFAQNPTYYKIGETELESEDVYSICSNSDNVLYLGVENGLIKYENQTFRYLSFQKEFNNHSLFHVTRNSKDEIFCIDLKGRIFKAQQDSLIHIFSLDHEYINTLPQLICGPDDNLYLASEKIYKISSEGALLEIFDHYSKLHPLKDKSFFFFDSTGIVHISKNDVNHYDATIYHDKDIKYAQTVYLAKRWLSSPNRSVSDKFPTVEGISIEESIQNYDYCYQLDTNRLYVLNHVQGVSEIIIGEDEISLESRFFEDYFISSYCSADNGTKYFGTFKQGIIVVPNSQIKTYSSKLQPKSILDLEVNSDDEIYVSLRNKGLFKLTNKGPKLIEKSTRFSFSKIIYADSLSYSDAIHGKDKMFYKTNYTGALKDLEVINREVGIMLCNSGLNLLGSQDTFLQQQWIKKRSLHFYDKLRGRNLAVEFDEKNQKLYVANQYDLYLIGRGIEPKGIKYNSKPIVASELLFCNDTLWITDFQKGVLSLVDGRVKQEFSTNNGLYSNIATQLLKHDNKLFVITSGRLQVIDLPTRKIIPISQNFGVLGKVNKIIIRNHNLWILVDNSEILSIPIKKLPHTISPISLRIKSIFNNETEVPSFDKNKFSKSENKFLFILDLYNHSHIDEAILCYRLVGLDDSYKCVPFTNKGIEYKSLPPGKYTFKAYSKFGSISSNEVRYVFHVRQAFWLSTSFILSVIALSLGFIYWFLKVRMKIQDRRTEQKYREHLINLELMESKLTALRSQMNPHFIFNSLNAIQDLILKKDSLLAYDYIVLFSQLTRSTLHFSTKEYIPLKKEIEFLSIYLKLEKLRFNDDFLYKIESDQTSDILVPSLIIQPFIENALNHGLRNKIGSKLLEVIFTQEKNELKCIIRDNGIGQKEALKIKMRQGDYQHSFALQSIKDRLRILSKRHNQIYSYEIIDLSNEGKSCGTEVRLHIPYHSGAEKNEV